MKTLITAILLTTISFSAMAVKLEPIEDSPYISEEGKRADPYYHMRGKYNEVR